MICRECKAPLTLYSIIREDGSEDRIIYIHPGEYIDAFDRISPLGDSYDHEAVPIEATPAEADTKCDFCFKTLIGRVWVFVPRKPIEVPDPHAFDRVLSYSSPWTCCDGCLPAVKSKNITRMINIAIGSHYSIANGMSTSEKQFARKALHSFYSQYLKSNPVGPYERKIIDHKPFGKPASRRGM